MNAKLCLAFKVGKWKLTINFNLDAVDNFGNDEG